MSRLVVATFVTLDGVMQAPGGPQEDPTGGFEHGGWVAPHFDDSMGSVMVETMERADAFLLGRRTYEIFAAHWPYISAGDPIAAKLNGTPKYVASRTLRRLDWSGSTLLDGDVADAVRQLKARGGNEIQVHGSGNLIQTLLAHDLIDEFRLWVFPIVLGKGKRLFGTGTVPARLELVETLAASTGPVFHVYRAAGRPETGSFALEQPTAAEIERRRKHAEEERQTASASAASR
jgi:dihydrofolate reductase